MGRLVLFSLVLFLSIFIFSSCDSPSGSKPDAVTRPSLSTPADNATNVSLTPTFTWSGAADILQVATNPNFDPAFHSVDVSGQSYQMPSGKLQKNMLYYWHAGKRSGSEIYWSDEKFSFRTIQ